MLPFEVELNFGMRRFVILITDNKLPFPTFRRDLEKFVYSSMRLASELEATEENHSRFTHEISREAKGKEALDREGARRNHGRDEREVARYGTRDGGVQEWQPEINTDIARPVSTAPGAQKEL